MKIDSFLVSIVAILGLVAVCAIAMACDIDGGLLYTGVGSISGIAGYNIKKIANGQEGKSNKTPPS